MKFTLSLLILFSFSMASAHNTYYWPGMADAARVECPIPAGTHRMAQQYLKRYLDGEMLNAALLTGVSQLNSTYVEIAKCYICAFGKPFEATWERNSRLKCGDKFVPHFDYIKEFAAYSEEMAYSGPNRDDVYGKCNVNEEDLKVDAMGILRWYLHGTASNSQFMKRFLKFEPTKRKMAECVVCEFGRPNHKVLDRRFLLECENGPVPVAD